MARMRLVRVVLLWPAGRSNMQKLIIYGLSSPLIFRLIDAINRHRPSIDVQGIVLSPGDDPEIDRYGYPLLGDAAVLPDLGKQDDLFFFCNVNRSPREIQEADAWLAENGCRTLNLVHPDIDLSHVRLGTNVFLAEGCLVGPGSVLGDHVTVRMGTIISHDVILEDRVYISPGVCVCGTTTLREGCDIGAGVTIMPYLTIGKNTIVGAGAVVTQDLPDNVTAVGVPAKVIKTHAPDDERFFGNTTNP